MTCISSVEAYSSLFTVGRFFIGLDPWLSQIKTVQGQEKAASKRHCKRWSAGYEPERGLVAIRGIVPNSRHIQRSVRHAGCGKTSIGSLFFIPNASPAPTKTVVTLVIHKPLSWWVMMRCLFFACHVQGRAAVPMVNFHYCCMAWNRMKQRTHVWPRNLCPLPNPSTISWNWGASFWRGEFSRFDTRAFLWCSDRGDGIQGWHCDEL